MLRVRSMKYAAILIFALTVSCSHPVSSPPANSASTPLSPKSSEIKRPSTVFPLPQIQTFNQETLERYSYSRVRDEKTHILHSLPPWKWAALDLSFEKYPSPPPKHENMVTVIPLGVDISPIELRIIKVCPKEYPIEQKVYHYCCEAELEPITQTEFLEYKKDDELPFDVLWIYPSVEFSLPISRDKLTDEMLPEGVDRNTVTAAIDLTNDQKPDLLMVQYCVKPAPADLPDAPPCLSMCYKKYVKESEGKWKQIEEFLPCPKG
jgi:hypothetical protein